MYDFHVHSDFSIDSKETMDKVIMSAINKGVKTICFTDHVDLEGTIDKMDLMFRPLDYFRSVNKVKYKYRNNIEVLTGVEVGMQPHLVQRYDDFINSFSFDFVIMSIHAINGRDIFYDYSNELNNQEDILTTYYNDMLSCVNNYNNYDVLGHIDYIDRYIPKLNENLNYNKHISLIESILKAVISNGKGIEINTSGLRYNLGYSHPKNYILQMYKELGGEIITFGSDAHISPHVAYEYKHFEKTLKRFGFKYVFLYRDRKKFPIQI